MKVVLSAPAIAAPPLTGASTVQPNSPGVQKSEVTARHMKINPPHYRCHAFLSVAGPQARHPG